jgi:hypothetical protein
MQDTDLEPGQRVQRHGGQLVGCGLFKCEWNLDGECYCKELHVGQVKGIVAPVCLKYIGELLDEYTS